MAAVAVLLVALVVDPTVLVVAVVPAYTEMNQVVVPLAAVLGATREVFPILVAAVVVPAVDAVIEVVVPVAALLVAYPMIVATPCFLLPPPLACLEDLYFVVVPKKQKKDAWYDAAAVAVAPLFLRHLSLHLLAPIVAPMASVADHRFLRWWHDVPIVELLVMVAVLPHSLVVAPTTFPGLILFPLVPLTVPSVHIGCHSIDSRVQTNSNSTHHLVAGLSTWSLLFPQNHPSPPPQLLLLLLPLQVPPLALHLPTLQSAASLPQQSLEVEGVVPTV